MKDIVIDKFNLGEVRYCDCLDPDYGLPALEDNTFDLVYSDPPWGVGIGKTLKNGRKYLNGRELRPKKEKQYYEDDFKPEWNLKWFNEMERVSKSIILILSEPHKKWWYRHTDPIGDLTIHWTNGHARSKVAKWSRKSTYFIYGDLPNKLEYDIIINQTMRWGFLSNWKGKHPSPKIGLNDLKFNLHYDILEQIKPASLCDPFAGSGSFLYTSKMLGIPFLGYEINIGYKPDIDKRLAQKNLRCWIK